MNDERGGQSFTATIVTDKSGVHVLNGKGRSLVRLSGKYTISLTAWAVLYYYYVYKCGEKLLLCLLTDGNYAFLNLNDSLTVENHATEAQYSLPVDNNATAAEVQSLEGELSLAVPVGTQSSLVSASGNGISTTEENGLWSWSETLKLIQLYADNKSKFESSTVRRH